MESDKLVEEPTTVADLPELRGGSAETIDIPIGQVSLSKLMLRPKEDNYVKELSKSMSSIGQLDPLLVRPLPGGGFEIVDGNHRFEAAKQLGWAKVKCRVVPMDDAEAFQTAEATHVLRNQNVDPIAEATGFSILRSRGLSEDTIGKNVGKSQEYVSARLALLRLEPEIRTKVTSRLVKTEVAYELARCDDPRKRKLLAEMARTDQPQPLILREVRELVKASWNELYKNDHAKRILMTDPNECAMYAAADLEQLDETVRIATKGECRTVGDWIRTTAPLIHAPESRVAPAWLGEWKRDHCVNYDGDLCSYWHWKQQGGNTYLKQVGDVWRQRVSQYPDFCATCPIFQEKKTGS